MSSSAAATDPHKAELIRKAQAVRIPATRGDLQQVCFGQRRVTDQLASRRKDHGQVSIITHVLFSDIRLCNSLDTIVDNGRKKTMFRLLLDTALKTVAYRWQVIQIVETLVHRQVRFIPIKEGIEFDGQQDLRTKVMIAAGSCVVFQHQSGRYPHPLTDVD